MPTTLNRYRNEPSIAKSDGVQEILNALSDGLDELNNEDIEFAPMEQILAELDRIGDRNDHPFTPAPEAGIEALAKAEERAVPIVPRNELVWQIRGAIDAERVFVIRGACGTGKSALVHHLLSTAVREWHPFRRSLRLDCSALRTSDPIRLERAALWQVLGSDEILHRRFIAQLDNDEIESPFSAFLHRRGAGTLLVIDQAEHLDPTGSIGSWISKTLLPIAEQRKLSVLFCVRTPASGRGIRPLRELPFLEVKNYVQHELAEWLALPYFRSRADASLTPDRILRLTGGCPRLVRDFASYAVHRRQFDSRTLLDFARWRPNHFIVDCERFIWAARAFPEVLSEGLDVLSQPRKPSLKESTIREIKNSLVATGVVRPAAGSGLRFKSPIHQKRISVLLQAGALRLLACRAQFHQLERTNDVAVLRNFAELAPDVLGECIATESQPTVAFRRFQEILRRWGMDSRLRLRDPNNSRLWIHSAPLGTTPEIGGSSGYLTLESPSNPIDNLCSKWLVTAIHDGHPSISDDGDIFVPVIGNSGEVEFVVQGRLRGDQNPFDNQIAVERLIAIIRGMRRQVMHASMAFWVQRHSRVDGKLLYRLESGEPMMRWQSFVRSLADSGPAAILVLERSPRTWFVSKFEAFDRPGKPSIDRSWVEQQRPQRLDEIANHPSGRGLVIGGAEAASIFPNLKGEDTAIYLRPVWIGNREACRMVGFLFQGAVVGRLDGHLQHRLSAIAPEVIAIAS